MIKWGIKKLFAAWLFALMCSFLIASVILMFTGQFSITGAVTLGFIFNLTLFVPFFIFHLIFWNILIKPGLIIAVMVPYLILRLLIQLIVVIPLQYVGFMAKSGYGFFSNAEDRIRNNMKAYGALYGISLLGTMYFFLPRDFNSAVSFVTSATFVSILLFMIPTVIVLLIAGLISKSKSGGQEQQEQGNQLDPVETATAGMEAGKKGHKLYKNIKNNKGQIKSGANKVKGKAAGVGGKADNLVTSNKIPKGLVRNIQKVPGLRTLGPRLAGVAGGEAILFLIAVLLILVLVWLLVAAIFYLAIYIFLGPYVGTVMGFANAQAGLGMDYGQWAGQEVGGAVPSYDFTGERNALRLAWGRVECALSGPQCLRELQANNSQRPGSESVGTKFGLEIEEFSVNNGYKFDIAGRQKDDNVPISFDVYNPIKNFRGIDARGVQYRLTVDGGETCIANGTEDLWGKTLGSGLIRAGTFERPTGELEDLTLENCGMLQPALGSNKDAELQIKYNYSSQSTLQFEAMSEDYLSQEGLRSEPTQSETANTPVQTYVNVQSPVLFSEENGLREPNVFPVYLGFQTEQYDVGYRINIEDLEMESSSALIDVDTASKNYDKDYGGDCEALNYEGDGVYTVNMESSSAQNIKAQQENRWFSRGAGPSPFRCDMIIDPGESNTGPVSTITPTGETLTMRADANYSVRLSSQSENFEVLNNRCTAGNFNCPLIVTEEEAQGSTLRNTCDSDWRIDAAGGCTIVENRDDWGNPEAYNDENNYVTEIENRENAYRFGKLVEENLSREGTFESSSKDSYNPNAAVGFEPSDIEDFKQNENSYAIVNEGSNSNIDVAIEEIDRYELCKQHEDRILEFAEAATNSDVVYANVKINECRDSVAETIADTYGNNIECTIDFIDPRVNVFTTDGLIPDSCTRNFERFFETCNENEIIVYENDQQSCLAP